VRLAASLSIWRQANPMCRFLVQELRELQRAVTRSVVEQERHGVVQDIPQQPADQVPKVFGPHSLYTIALCELRKDGVDPVAQAAQEHAPFGGGIALLGAVGCEQRKIHAPRRFFSRLRRPVIAIPDDETAGGFEEFGEHREFVGVGGGNRDAADEPRPANAYVHPKAVERLPEKRVLAEGRFTAESTAAVGAGKQASRQGQRVHQREGRIVGSEGEELLLDALLDLPEVGGLTGEVGAVDLPEGGEPFSVVAAEDEVDALVSVYAEELAYELYGENFRVGKLRSWTALTRGFPVFELVVDEAEDGNDKGAKINEQKTSVWRCYWANTERREVFSLAQVFTRNVHTRLARNLPMRFGRLPCPVSSEAPTRMYA
jgi:hypothetical protein